MSRLAFALVDAILPISNHTISEYLPCDGSIMEDMEDYAWPCISVRIGNVLISADPDVGWSDCVHRGVYVNRRSRAPSPLTGAEACASEMFTHSCMMRGTGCLGRGPIREPGRRIVPAP